MFFKRLKSILISLFFLFSALSNYELASFLRWYLVLELHDPSHARRYLCTYEMLEDAIMRVCFSFPFGF